MRDNGRKLKAFILILLSAAYFVAPAAEARVFVRGQKACLGLGEENSAPGVPGKAGWKLDPPCCPGLTDRESLKVCGQGHGGGYAHICIKCGDGKCDSRYESKCNCPGDCQSE